MESRRRKRVLSQGEHELWERATRHDTPLTRPKRIAADQNSESPLLPAEKPVPPLSQSIPAPPKLQPPSGQPRKPAVHPRPEPFDVRESRRLARGRREIGARLDLHGMRQQDAYAALRQFLANAQADGHRHVLIITGKGRAGAAQERDFWRPEERGVLRRLVPHWLSDPAISAHVVSFTESAHRHGGSGALYVTIRKRTIR